MHSHMLWHTQTRCLGKVQGCTVPFRSHLLASLPLTAAGEEGPAVPLMSGAPRNILYLRLSSCHSAMPGVGSRLTMVCSAVDIMLDRAVLTPASLASAGIAVALSSAACSAARWADICGIAMSLTRLGWTRAACQSTAQGQRVSTVVLGITSALPVFVNVSGWHLCSAPAHPTAASMNAKKTSSMAVPYCYKGRRVTIT